MHPAACDRRPTARRISGRDHAHRRCHGLRARRRRPAHSGMPVTTMLRRTSIQIRVHRIYRRPREEHHLAARRPPPQPHGRSHASRSAAVVWGARGRSNLAVLNGGAWHWHSGTPVGTVVSRGRVVHIDRRNPAVGYTARATSSSGRAPPAQHTSGTSSTPRPIWWCTDTPGPGAELGDAHPVAVRCAGNRRRRGLLRSVVAKFRNGRVGMLEIAYISMPAAARLLQKMGPEPPSHSTAAAGHRVVSRRSRRMSTSLAGRRAASA